MGGQISTDIVDVVSVYADYFKYSVGQAAIICSHTQAATFKRGLRVVVGDAWEVTKLHVGMRRPRAGVMWNLQWIHLSRWNGKAVYIVGLLACLNHEG